MSELRIRAMVLDTLSSAAGILPSETADWYQAMLAEAEETGGLWEFLSWIAGALTTTCVLALRQVLRPSSTPRPLAATLVAFYFACFSSFALLRLGGEILTGRIPLLMGHTWISVLRCFAVVLASLAIAIATWSCRNQARHLAVLFAAVHLVGVLVEVSAAQNELITLTKVCADLAVILAMRSRHIRSAFHPPGSTGAGHAHR